MNLQNILKKAEISLQGDWFDPNAAFMMVVDSGLNQGRCFKFSIIK